MQGVPGLTGAQSLSALATGLQSGSAMFDAVAQSNALRGSAAADLDNARSAELQGAFNIHDIRRRGRAVQGEAIAALAEGGGDISGGSAQDLIYQNALDIEYAAANARYSAAQEARGYRFRSAQEKQAARNAIYGGILRAGAAAITGVADARNRAKEDQAASERYNAFFPGGQRLPMPTAPPPYYSQYRPGP